MEFDRFFVLEAVNCKWIAEDRGPVNFHAARRHAPALDALELNALWLHGQVQLGEALIEKSGDCAAKAVPPIAHGHAICEPSGTCRYRHRNRLFVVVVTIAEQVMRLTFRETEVLQCIAELVASKAVL